jgi:hypothetical protein
LRNPRSRRHTHALRLLSPNAKFSSRGAR